MRRRESPRLSVRFYAIALLQTEQVIYGYSVIARDGNEKRDRRFPLRFFVPQISDRPYVEIACKAPLSEVAFRP